MIKTLLATTIFAGLAMGVAHATTAQPTLEYSIYDGSTLIGFGSTTNGRILNGSGMDNNFSISLQGFGSPYLNSPDFSNNQTSITNMSGAAGTLTIKITDYNLPAYPGGNIANTFTLNSLNAPGFVSGTVANYFDASNAKYGMGTLIASSGTYSGSASFSGMSNASVGAFSSPFSETTIYTLTFKASGSNSTVSASSQMNSVPEPASLALVGGGLAALGMIRRRKQA